MAGFTLKEEVTTEPHSLNFLPRGHFTSLSTTQQPPLTTAIPASTCPAATTRDDRASKLSLNHSMTGRKHDPTFRACSQTLQRSRPPSQQPPPLSLKVWELMITASTLRASTSTSPAARLTGLTTSLTSSLKTSLSSQQTKILSLAEIQSGRSQTHRPHDESHQQSEDQSEFSANKNSFPGGDSKRSTSRAKEGVEEEDDIEAEDGVAVNNPFLFTEEDILNFIDQPLKTRRELQEAFQQAKAKGNMPLIHFIYDQEIACTTLRDADRDFTVKEMYMVYLFLHEKIVDGLIDGTLPRSLNDQSSEEYRIHQKLLQRAISARNPAYYMATITSRSGEAPTFRDMEKALNMFDQYCDGNMSAILQIDSKRGVAADKSKTGFRFFFADANDRFVTRRQQVCKTFSRNLRPQLNFRDYFREGLLTPFRDLLAYFGVSGNEAGFQCNTNYVMQLFLECLRVTQRDKLEPYEIRKFVVGLCGEPQHAALGEILVSRLGQGYITSRTGFAHYPAGQGVDISFSVKEWDHHFAWMEDNTPS